MCKPADSGCSSYRAVLNNHGEFPKCPPGRIPSGSSGENIAHTEPQAGILHSMSRGDNPDTNAPLTVGGILAGRTVTKPIRETAPEAPALTPRATQKALRDYSEAVKKLWQLESDLVHKKTPEMIEMVKEQVFAMHPSLVAFGLTCEEDPYMDENCVHQFGETHNPAIIIRDREGRLVNIGEVENIARLPEDQIEEMGQLRDDVSAFVAHLSIDMLGKCFGGHGWSALFTRDGDIFYDREGVSYENSNHALAEEFEKYYPYDLNPE